VIRFALLRIGLGALVVWGVYTLTFFAVNVAPGSPFSDLLLETGQDPQQVAQLEARWGYDRPIAERYAVQLRSMFWSDADGLTFDLGYSISRQAPIATFLAAPITNTVLLASAALALDFALGILLGVISALRSGTRFDRALSVGTLFVYSMPAFWLALVLVYALGVSARLLPTGGMTSPGVTWHADFASFADFLRHLVLPALVLGVGGAAATARFQRAALIEVLAHDYVRAARARGLTESAIVWRHALQNALAPVLTLFGLALPFLVSGSVIVETVFSWPGMGRELVAAVTRRDDLLVTAITLVSSTLVVAGSIVADILHALVDPRVTLR